MSCETCDITFVTSGANCLPLNLTFPLLFQLLFLTASAIANPVADSDPVADPITDPDTESNPDSDPWLGYSTYGGYYPGYPSGLVSTQVGFPGLVNPNVATSYSVLRNSLVNPLGFGYGNAVVHPGVGKRSAEPEPIYGIVKALLSSNNYNNNRGRGRSFRRGGHGHGRNRGRGRGRGRGRNRPILITVSHTPTYSTYGSSSRGCSYGCGSSGHYH